ncbi:MAG: ATPase domain-containing protein [Candidatus Binatia bacterium]
MNTKRVSTGIPGLDPVIEGGFLAGKSYLITGEPGTGKSIFCMQFVLKGLLEGEKAVYVAVDEKPDDIVEEAASLGWDLVKYTEERKLLILDASSYFSSRVGASRGAGVDIAKTIADLASYVKRMGASRVVIDPVGPLISTYNSAAHLQEHARMLVHSLHDHMGTTNLLTSYSSRGSPGGQGIEEYLVAGVVVLGATRVQNCLTRTLLVRKMRCTATDLMECRFSIVKEKGITLQKAL